MFVTVKALTTLIDQNLRYVAEAIESKAQHEDSKFNDYIERMETILKRQIEELKRISSNQKLIAKYESKVTEIFYDIDV